MATRAADRTKMIATLQEESDPLAQDYSTASERAESGTRMARKGGDYPMLSCGDVNLYSLFVERAMTLVKQDGLIGLLVPSGIASDKTAAKFFKGVATEGQLKALYDFENGRQGRSGGPFFPDVHRSFKFCALVASPSPTEFAAQCAFFLHDVTDLAEEGVKFTLTAEDFARVNPNTGTAPIFRSKRDADLTIAIYGNAVPLIDRSSGEEAKAWPVKYLRMFDMTNDSGLFRTRDELENQEGGYPLGGNIYGSASGNWLPLYVGRMIHQFDHRAASVEVNEANLHNAALSGAVTEEQKADPDFVPTPQYWVRESDVDLPSDIEWTIAFRDIARTTDARTMIATVVPKAGFGNKAPLLMPENMDAYRSCADLIVANLNSLSFDFVARSKVHSTSLNWYIAEQLPVIPPKMFESIRFGTKSAAEVVREAVLELVYTAHDLASFARDMGYVDEVGSVEAPFIWDKERRLVLRAKLDAVFFCLYGIADRDDIRHIYSTFPIIEREEKAAYGGKYRSFDLCLAYMNALAAGNPDAEIKL